MLDISKVDLPCCFILYTDKGIKEYEVKTSFRYWIQLSDIFEDIGEKLKRKTFTLTEEYKDILSLLFKDTKPTTKDEWDKAIPLLVEFFVSPSKTPNQKEEDKPDNKVFDFIEDGEYIYASFYQAYGIDLFDTDMHWHIFLALFRSLPQNTKICEIMSKRCWKKPSKNTKEEDLREKEKELWTLPKNKEKEQKENNDINNLFPYTDK